MKGGIHDALFIIFWEERLLQNPHEIIHTFESVINWSDIFHICNIASDTCHSLTVLKYILQQQQSSHTVNTNKQKQQ
jgi:hypothetical protein